MRYGEPSRDVSSNASSPCSAATARSSSDIALAIHVTSWCATRPRRAVTSPPPPRFATRSPSAVRAYATGPRLATTISLRRALTPKTVSRALRKPLHEAQLGAARPEARLQLELVCDRLDDRDPEAALRQLLPDRLVRRVRVEARSVV